MSEQVCPLFNLPKWSGSRINLGSLMYVMYLCIKLVSHTPRAVMFTAALAQWQRFGFEPLVWIDPHDSREGW